MAKKGNATIEYAAMIIIFVAALLLIQSYIVHGFCGRWRSTGEVFGFGRQFEPANTVETETAIPDVP